MDPNQSTPTPVPTPTISTVTATPGVSEDINGDKAINMADAMLIAAHFNQVSTDANFDKKCDINGDNAINMSDVMLIANKFNQTV